MNTSAESADVRTTLRDAHRRVLRNDQMDQLAAATRARLTGHRDNGTSSDMPRTIQIRSRKLPIAPL